MISYQFFPFFYLNYFFLGNEYLSLINQRKHPSYTYTMERQEYVHWMLPTLVFISII